MDDLGVALFRKTSIFIPCEPAPVARRHRGWALHHPPTTPAVVEPFGNGLVPWENWENLQETSETHGLLGKFQGKTDLGKSTGKYGFSFKYRSKKQNHTNSGNLEHNFDEQAKSIPSEIQDIACLQVMTRSINHPVSPRAVFARGYIDFLTHSWPGQMTVKKPACDCKVADVILKASLWPADLFCKSSINGS